MASLRDTTYSPNPTSGRSAPTSSSTKTASSSTSRKATPQSIPTTPSRSAPICTKSSPPNSRKAPSAFERCLSLLQESTHRRVALQSNRDLVRLARFAERTGLRQQPCDQPGEKRRFFCQITASGIRPTRVRPPLRECRVNRIQHRVEPAGKLL